MNILYKKSSSLIVAMMFLFLLLFTMGCASQEYGTSQEERQDVTPEQEENIDELVTEYYVDESDDFEFEDMI